MFALIGLGNPGAEYAATRHNTGFLVIDAVAEKLGLRFQAVDGGYLLAEGKIDNWDVLLIKPLTYMNNSGYAVRDAIERCQIDVRNFLVIVDDFHLPLGAIRIRHRGSDGGHNGLRSIAHHLQSTDFARMRCGIAGESMPEEKSLMAEYVLSPFTSSEMKALRRLVDAARDAAIACASDGVDAAMQKFNSRVH